MDRDREAFEAWWDARASLSQAVPPMLVSAAWQAALAYVRGGGEGAAIARRSPAGATLRSLHGPWRI